MGQNRDIETLENIVYMQDVNYPGALFTSIV